AKTFHFSIPSPCIRDICWRSGSCMDCTEQQIDICDGYCGILLLGRLGINFHVTLSFMVYLCRFGVRLFPNGLFCKEHYLKRLKYKQTDRKLLNYANSLLKDVNLKLKRHESLNHLVIISKKSKRVIKSNFII